VLGGLPVHDSTHIERIRSVDDFGESWKTTRTIGGKGAGAGCWSRSPRSAPPSPTTRAPASESASTDCPQRKVRPLSTPQGTSRHQYATLARAAAAAILATAAVLLPAQPSMAVGCVGSACDGKNPQTMGCSTGAQIKKERTWFQEVTLQLRYSPACDAWWTRAICDRPDPTSALSVHIVQELLQNGVWREADRQRIVGTYHDVPCEGGQSWTYMIGDFPHNDRYYTCYTVSHPTMPVTPPHDSDSCISI
jgi:hypothetical protein